MLIDFADSSSGYVRVVFNKPLYIRHVQISVTFN